VDGGYFPRGESVLRRVHGARIVGLVYGQRALVVQATHPLAFAGLMANTSGQATPFQRLVHTAKTMETVFFGPRAEVDGEMARIGRLHARVRGSLEAPAGRHPAGAEYSAMDPEFLLWILACIADSAEATYEAFVRELSPSEQERYWQDYLLVGELFGLSRSDAPASYDEYRAYMAERVSSPDLHVLDEARDICRRILFEMPLPASRGPAVGVLHFAVIGLLPTRVRKLYGFDWDPLRQIAFEALKRAHRAAAPAIPARVRRGSCAADYDVVAREERRRLRAEETARASLHQRSTSD
jgi:uncharacterized protein (DUF2236 family)